MSALPDTVSVAHARLPQTYEEAKNALANCERIDECKDWADKAEALASYARMADDDTLRKHADRIQARAVRRAGELLKQIDGRGKNKGALTSSQAASDAGMSIHQQRQASRVANIPESDFNVAVESDNPPTVTKLADMGKNTRFSHDKPENFQAATEVIGEIRRCVAVFRKHEPEFVVDGINPKEVAEMREAVGVMDAWLDRFIINLPE